MNKDGKDGKGRGRPPRDQAAAAVALKALAGTGRKYAKARDELDRLGAVLVAQVLAATDAGATRRAAAEAAGVSPGRVQQIIDARGRA